MLLGERGKFGGTVDVTGGEKKALSMYMCLCTLACLCNCVFMFVCTVYVMLRKRGSSLVVTDGGSLLSCFCGCVWVVFLCFALVCMYLCM